MNRTASLLATLALTLASTVAAEEKFGRWRFFESYDDFDEVWTYRVVNRESDGLLEVRCSRSENARSISILLTPLPISSFTTPAVARVRYKVPESKPVSLFWTSSRTRFVTQDEALLRALRNSERVAFRYYDAGESQYTTEFIMFGADEAITRVSEPCLEDLRP